MRTGEQVAALDDLGGTFDFGLHLRSISFDADSSLMLATNRAGGYQAWNTATWDPIDTPLDLGPTQLVSFSLDGRYLATVAPDGTIALRHPTTMEVVRFLTGAVPPEVIGGHLYWSSDGTLLLSLFETVGRLWDVESGQQIGDLFPNDTEIFAGAASGDILRLATRVGDHVLVWNLDIETWPEIACRAAGRNMTAPEWEQFGPAGESYRATCPQYGLEPATG